MFAHFMKARLYAQILIALLLVNICLQPALPVSAGINPNIREAVADPASQDPDDDALLTGGSRQVTPPPPISASLDITPTAVVTSTLQPKNLEPKQQTTTAKNAESSNAVGPSQAPVTKAPQSSPSGKTPAAVMVVTVDTTANTIDGTTSSVDALTAPDGSGKGADGMISLAEAIRAVNNTGPGYTINFNLPHGSVISDPGSGNRFYLAVSNTIIDGDTNGDSKPDVLLQGSSYYNILSIESDHNIIRNLAVQGLALQQTTAHDNLITNCYLGTDIEGKLAGGTEHDGVEIRLGAYNNIVENNIIAGNGGIDPNFDSYGVLIWNDAHDNIIRGNKIGVNVDGNALANDYGVGIGYGGTSAANNTIGGDRGQTTDCVNPCNVISGNPWGIVIEGPSSSNNKVYGNYVGIKPDGTGAMGNTYTGIFIYRGAISNTIGAPRASIVCNSRCNIIAGNGYEGITISNTGTKLNTIEGNNIGVGTSGQSIPNGGNGIAVISGAQLNNIGGSSANGAAGCSEKCNVISANQQNGVIIDGSGTMTNTVAGNFIGVTSSGTFTLPNALNAIAISNGASNNTIGGSRPSYQCTGTCNILSGNTGSGVIIDGTGTSGNTVLGNYIGLNISRDLKGNVSHGVMIQNGASANQIGGNRTGTACDGPCNFIGGNAGYGLVLNGATTANNKVQGNYIGVGETETISASNKYAGIAIANGAIGNKIGDTRAPGDCAGPCNLITHNLEGGIIVLNDATRANAIRGNSIYDNNGYQGIDLYADGPTLNDLGGLPRTGPNDRMVFPQSITADYNGSSTTFSGIISTTNPTNVSVEIFATQQLNRYGYTEGQRLVATATPQSNGTFQVTVNGALPYPNAQLSATATDATGNTSEFSIRTPLVFIHGVAASQLVDMANGDELWPGLFSSSFRLSLYPEDHPAATITATEPLRYIPVQAENNQWMIQTPDQIAYGPLLDMLQRMSGDRAGGYIAYQTNSIPARRTTAGCDLSQKSHAPTLFTFAYDWRLSNIQNAARLKDYMGCVQQFYPGAKVDVLTHSMGSVLARRYILDYPNDNQIQRLITIGAPWLGAAKLIYAIETGDFVPIISSAATKVVIGSAPAAHQLMPGRAYYDLSADLNGYAPGTISATLTSPIFEAGWDLNNNGKKDENYTYEQYINIMNARYGHTSPGGATILPGTTGDQFHSYTNAQGNKQDDWSNDTTGIKYYHFFGVQSGDTSIGGVRAVTKVVCSTQIIPGIPPTLYRSCVPKQTFEKVFTRGDGTVPQLSAQRVGPTINYNAPNAKLIRVCGFDEATNQGAEHTGMASNTAVHDRILTLISQGTASELANCPTNGVPPAPRDQSDQPADKQPLATDAPAQPYYYATVLGGTSVMISDSNGHSTAVITGTLHGTVPGASSYIIGENAYQLVIPTTGNYTVTFQTTEQAQAVEIKKGTSETTSQLVRYIDMSLPISKTAILKFTPQGVDTLRYDSTGNGNFDTAVQPSVTTTGTQANDQDAPTINILATKQQNTTSVTLSATDSGSGLKDLSYSLDGVHYSTYTTTLQLNPAQTPTLNVMANDNVGNRATESYPVGTITDNTKLVFVPVALRSKSGGW